MRSAGEPRRRKPTVYALLVGLAAVLVGSVVAGCSSSPSTTGPTSSHPSVLDVPLASSTAAASNSFAILAMGNLDDPLNTFWQLFTRTGVSASWQLATPPGVASNGGLVTSITPGQLIAGFEPSQALVFSPLLRSVDNGTTWAQSSLPGGGLLPAGLASVPDALAGPSTLGYLALVRTSGGEVLSGAAGSTRWAKVTDVAQLASTPESSRCGVADLTAVAFDPDGTELVGTTCVRGTRVGIFQRANGLWRWTGPVLAGVTSGPIQVLRLLGSGAQVTALGECGSPRGAEAVRDLGQEWGKDLGSLDPTADWRRPGHGQRFHGIGSVNRPARQWEIETIGVGRHGARRLLAKAANPAGRHVCDRRWPERILRGVDRRPLDTRGAATHPRRLAPGAIVEGRDPVRVLQLIAL